MTHNNNILGKRAVVIGKIRGNFFSNKLLLSSIGSTQSSSETLLLFRVDLAFYSLISFSNRCNFVPRCLDVFNVLNTWNNWIPLDDALYGDFTKSQQIVEFEYSQATEVSPSQLNTQYIYLMKKIIFFGTQCGIVTHPKYTLVSLES